MQRNSIDRHRFQDIQDNGSSLTEFSDSLYDDIRHRNTENVKTKLAQLTPEEIDLINNCNNDPFDLYSFYLKITAQNNDVAMLNALKEGGINIIRKFPMTSPQINILFSDGIIAANAEFITYLIKAGIDLNLKNELGNTALWKIVDIKNIENILIMLQAGADVYGEMGFNRQLNRTATMKEEIERLIPNIQFINVGIETCPVYRMADDFGRPFKTRQELYNEKFTSAFKQNNNTKYVVSLSLFKDCTNGNAIADALSSEVNLAGYLDLQEIHSVSLVSAVKVDEKIVNSSYLSEARDESDKKARNSFKNN